MNPVSQISSDRLKQLSEFLKRQKENNKFVRGVEVGVTFLLISFFLFFAIKPTALTISSLVGEIKSKELLNAQMKGKIENIMKAQEAYSLAQGRYSIIEASLPDRPGFYEAFDQVKESLNSVGTPFDNGGFDLAKIDEKDEKNPNVKTYSVSLTVKNSFVNSQKIITDLLSNRRLINISAISFRNGTENNKDSDNPSNLTTNFSATFFYWQK